MKKLIALLLFVSCVLTSCAGVIENSNFKTDGYILIDDKETVPEYVMKIGDNSISFAEYRYYYLNEKYELDGGDEKIWTDYPEFVDKLKEYTEASLIEVYSIRSLAAENGVAPNYEQVADEIKGYKEGMSSTDFKSGLASYHLTEELFEYILQGYELYTSLFDHYFGENGTRSMTDREMLQYLEDNYLHAKHILIYPNTTMSDEEYESLLNTVAEKASTTEDFDALVKEYSNDDAMPEYGYYFTEDEMPDEFVTACKELEYGEISGIVKSSHGYHVIQKLPIEEDDLGKLKDVVYNRIFAELIDGRINSIEVEYAPEYEYIAPDTVK